MRRLLCLVLLLVGCRSESAADRLEAAKVKLNALESKADEIKPYVLNDEGRLVEGTSPEYEAAKVGVEQQRKVVDGIVKEMSQ